MLKKIILITLITTTLNSCNSKPEEIKLTELKTACDYIKAEESIVDEFLKLQEQHPEALKGLFLFAAGDKPIIETEFTNKFKKLYKKLEELDNASRMKFTSAEFKECSNTDVLDKKTRQMKLYERNL
jgi:benzoyl-CoA reductase/2-hydroxyglutaryl-CoA dehydratase subunit BcrC/BadD/HgdB